MKKYLITTDIDHLITIWARDNSFKPPESAFFKRIDFEIGRAVQAAVGKEAHVRLMPEDILTDGIIGLIDRYSEGKPLVVVDRLFHYMDVRNHTEEYHSTRAVQIIDGRYVNFGDCPRPGTPDFDEQAEVIVRRLRCHVPEFENDREVIIVDDGCYEGKSLKNIAAVLKKAGLVIKCAIVGIFRGPDEPVDFGFPVHSFLKYPKGSLLDWICERDFIPGVMDGGRFINNGATDGLQHCVPYLLGFGSMENMDDWASIKDERKAAEFSRRMIYLARKIFFEIEVLSRRPVLCKDIRRWPHFKFAPLPRDTEERFTDALPQI